MLSLYHPGMPMDEDAGIDDEKLRLAKLNMTERFPFLIYPYGINKVLADNDVLIVSDIESGMYHTKMGDSEGSLDSYEIEFVEHQL